jgi:hypothetical protein
MIHKNGWCTYISGQLKARDDLVDNQLKFGVLICVCSDAYGNIVLRMCVFGVDNTQKCITTPGQAQFLDLRKVNIASKLTIKFIRTTTPLGVFVFNSNLVLSGNSLVSKSILMLHKILWWLTMPLHTTRLLANI